MVDRGLRSGVYDGGLLLRVYCDGVDLRNVDRTAAVVAARTAADQPIRVFRDGAFVVRGTAPGS